jgi:hypothetical protein
VENGRVPTTEPFMPLAKGVSVVDSAWLAQVAGYVAYRAAGPAALQFLHAACIVSCCVALVAVICRNQRGTVPALVGMAALVATQWFQWQIIRPQIAGQLAFALLLWLLSARRYHFATLMATTGLFVFWANLHGSFAIGIAVIVLMVAGRAIDLWRRSGASFRILDDRLVRQFGSLTGFALLAGLVNPRGTGLYGEVFQFTANPNLRSLLEWSPLNFATWQGRMFLVVLLLLAANTSLRWKQFRFREGLPLLVLTVATLLSARFIVWWGTLAACELGRAAAALTQGRGRAAAKRPAVSLLWTGVAAASLAIACLVTPLSRRLITGTGPSAAEAFSPQTPLAAVSWLQEHPPQGLVFNSYEWGDYLVWAGPAGVQVFVTSHVHVIPPAVWQDYRQFSQARGDWEAGLDRYGVNSILLDRRKHARLESALGASNGWRIAYDDPQAVLFVRR